MNFTVNFYKIGGKLYKYQVDSCTAEVNYTNINRDIAEKKKVEL